MNETPPKKPTYPVPILDILRTPPYLTIEERGRLRFALATQSPKVTPMPATVERKSE